MNMRLLGAPTIKDVVPSMVDANSLSIHTASVPEDRLYGGNCAYISQIPQVVQLLIDCPSVDESLHSAQILGPASKL